MVLHFFVNMDKRPNAIVCLSAKGELHWAILCSNAIGCWCFLMILLFGHNDRVEKQRKNVPGKSLCFQPDPVICYWLMFILFVAHDNHWLFISYLYIVE